MNLVHKIASKIKSYKHKVDVIKLNVRSITNRSIGINMNRNRKKEIIISMTTYPKRFNVVHIAIESLLTQTLKPDLIVLYLAKDELSNGEIPKHLARLKKRGLNITIVNENLRSYKKLIYAIEEFPDAILITVDDDILYPEYFVEKLYERHLQYPKEIIAYRCSIMRRKSDTELLPYLSWKKAAGIVQPSFELFFTGVGGVLYPPNSLHKDVLNKKLFLALAPNADDIWFKAMSLLNGTKVMQVFEDSIEFPIINQKSQESALWKTNNGQQENDIQLKKVFDYFKLYKYISKDI
jgi:hypothetical protein